MLPQHESGLETCQRVHRILRQVEQAALVPGTDALAPWEVELGQAAALLEEMYNRMKNGRSLGESATRPALQQIRRTAGRLQSQFEHGSNYCMGLLQARLGTGYSEQGLPVLMPTEARGTFEG
jgi:hypothetical protein